MPDLSIWVQCLLKKFLTAVYRLMIGLNKIIIVSEPPGFAPSSFCGTGNEAKLGCLPRFSFRGWTYVGVCTLETAPAFWCYTKNGGWDYCKQDCQDEHTGEEPALSLLVLICHVTNRLTASIR